MKNSALKAFSCMHLNNPFHSYPHLGVKRKNSSLMFWWEYREKWRNLIFFFNSKLPKPRSSLLFIPHFPLDDIKRTFLLFKQGAWGREKMFKKEKRKIPEESGLIITQHREILSMNWHFIFPSIVCLREEQQTSNWDDYMKAGKTQLPAAKTKLLLTIPFLKSRHESQRNERKATHSWIAYWGYCRRLC